MRYLVVVFFLFPLFSYSQEDSLREQAVSYRQQGYELQSRGDLRRALVYYQKAIQIYPSYPEAYNDLGVIYESLGEEEKALEMYNKALSIDNEYLPALTNLAFFYEKRNNIQKAAFYWQRRYELGEEGEYWREVARQHLLKLGTYPKLKKEILERQAIQLSKELVKRRQEEKQKVIEEARLHFNLGWSLFSQGEYLKAIEEFKIALSLEPADKELKDKIRALYRKAQITHAKRKALTCTQQAMDYIKDDDYLSAGEKLKEAIQTVLSISRR